MLSLVAIFECGLILTSKCWYIYFFFLFNRNFRTVLLKKKSRISPPKFRMRKKESLIFFFFLGSRTNRVTAKIWPDKKLITALAVRNNLVKKNTSNEFAQKFATHSVQLTVVYYGYFVKLTWKPVFCRFVRSTIFDRCLLFKLSIFDIYNFKRIDSRFRRQKLIYLQRIDRLLLGIRLTVRRVSDVQEHVMRLSFTTFDYL